MNPDTVSLIETSGGWRELLNAREMNSLPNCVGVVLPHAMQETFAEMYGRMLLNDDIHWQEAGHPDLLNIGSLYTSPTIGECRTLLGELSLRPLSAECRLAVIWMSEKLSQEASNSLLKITEEPPKYGNILFIAEEDNFLPTIKSRIWLIYINLTEAAQCGQKAMPHDAKEWASWMDVSRKLSPEILYLEMQDWIRDCTLKNDFSRASDLDTMIRLMEQRKLSVPFITDSVFAVFKEGIPIEKIFGGLR
ncbi:MAG: hypothetical protein Q4E17_05250 [Synergistes sp.]|nr:hypothetical protein [Synergistes sp.]